MSKMIAFTFLGQKQRFIANSDFSHLVIVYVGMVVLKDLNNYNDTMNIPKFLIAALKCFIFN